MPDTIIAAIITGVLGLSAGFLPTYFLLYKPSQKSLKNEKNKFRGIHQTQKRIFANVTEMDNYYAERIKEAKHEILSLMWQDDSDDRVDHVRFTPDRRERQTGISDSVCSFCEDKNKVYKELFTFSFPKWYDFMKDRVERCGTNYECRYYNNFKKPVNKRFPKLQFRIIDNEEVVFSSRGYGSHLCAIKDKNLAGIMKTYFEIAWKNAIRIAPAQDEVMKKTFAEIENGIKGHLEWHSK